jgi:hypothetical protein
MGSARPVVPLSMRNNRSWDAKDAFYHNGRRKNRRTCYA